MWERDRDCHTHTCDTKLVRKMKAARTTTRRPPRWRWPRYRTRSMPVTSDVRCYYVKASPAARDIPEVGSLTWPPSEDPLLWPRRSVRHVEIVTLPARSLLRSDIALHTERGLWKTWTVVVVVCSCSCWQQGAALWDGFGNGRAEQGRKLVFQSHACPNVNWWLI